MRKDLDLKKLLSVIFVSLILLGSLFAIIFVTCFKEDNKNLVTDLIVSNQNLTIKVGDKIDLKDFYTIKPLDISANVLCLVENSRFAVIDENNVLTAKNAGNTKIYLKVNSGTDIIERDINLAIEDLTEDNQTENQTDNQTDEGNIQSDAQVNPTSLSFENENMNITLSDENCKNELIVTGDYNTTPVVEYSDETICEYNVNSGAITPKATGQTTVTVKFFNGKEEISKSFSVKVADDESISIELTSPIIQKVDDYYTISISSGSTKGKVVTISCKEDDVKKTGCVFSYEIITNSCGLVCQLDKESIVLKASNSGESDLKISLDGTDIFVILKVRAE